MKKTVITILLSLAAVPALACTSVIISGKVRADGRPVMMKHRDTSHKTNDIRWFQGDTLQSAIGQSFTEFTPLQMAEYCAAIANNGTRHSAALLKEVRSYDYSRVLHQREDEVLSVVDVDPSIFDGLHYGMWGVIYDPASTLTDTWLDCSEIVGAKTGTAQRGEGRLALVQGGRRRRHALSGRPAGRGLLFLIPLKAEYGGSRVHAAQITPGFPLQTSKRVFIIFSFRKPEKEDMPG